MGNKDYNMNYSVPANNNSNVYDFKSRQTPKIEGIERKLKVAQVLPLRKELKGHLADCGPDE